MENINLKELTKTLKIDAHAVGIPSGAANIFVGKALQDAIKSLKNKKLITRKDLDRAIVKELQKYNADFAYVYENRDKII